MFSIPFLQYLWGIETLSILFADDKLLYRFYSTYEELKPACISLKNPLYIGFYSTYEELKLNISWQ